MKTKNAPKGLKCKINQTFFWKQGFPKGGEGRGGPTFGKNSPKILFLFFFFFFFLGGGGGVPKRLRTFLTVVQKNPQHTYMCKQGGAGGYMAI